MSETVYKCAHCGWVTQAEDVSCDCRVPAPKDWIEGVALFGSEEGAIRAALEKALFVHKTITIFASQSVEDKKANEEHCAMLKAALDQIARRKVCH